MILRTSDAIDAAMTLVDEQIDHYEPGAPELTN